MTHRHSTIMHNLALIAFVTSLALGGCAPSPLEADYGQSVKQMTENQVYNPTTLSKPSAAAVEGADPDMLNTALKSMRTEAVDREKVSQPLVINVGGQGGQ